MRFWTLTAFISMSASAVFADTFKQSIQPLLKEYCIGCHSTEKQKGDLDLERFTSLDLVKRDPGVWEYSLDQIRDNEMPPKSKPKPSPEQMKLLTDWMQGTLDEVALANAGDPGPVVIRRLSNMEYTYTLRDLTGVASLDPAKEFPIDGAAGEGFTNAGAALVMSPALLTKYLDAAKDIASHTVLTPDGIHFSPSTSSRDWTDETLAKIRSFYVHHTLTGGGSQVTQQGVNLDVGTNAGRLPVAKYLDALNRKTNDDGLNAKYLDTLRKAFADTNSSPVLDTLRVKFRAGTIKVEDIETWQQSLWRFTSVGHIGKNGAPKAWQEAMVPLAARQEMRVKPGAPVDGGDVTIYLSTTDAGDGTENDLAVWENARLVAPGRADFPLKDVRAHMQQLVKRRETHSASVMKCLAAADEIERSTERIDIANVAQKHGVKPDILAGWLDYLGIESSGELKLGQLLTQKTEKAPDDNFIRGWTGENSLSVLANSSDATSHVVGTMKGHSIATHPSPKLASVIAWRSPVSGTLRISGSVQDANLGGGNGVTWAMELHRGKTRNVLASGVSEGEKIIDIGRHENIRVLPGDAIAVVIGPRDGDHSCDLTVIELVLNDGETEWDLAKDISPDILAGNPHADSHGNKDVWYFFGEPTLNDIASNIPDGSLLAMWRKTSDVAERERLAAQLQQLLQRGLAIVDKDSPDHTLHRQLLSFNGPLLAPFLRSVKSQDEDGTPSPYGVERSLFTGVDLNVQAPSLIEVRLPASLVDGAEFVVTGRLGSEEGSVQMQVLTSKPAVSSGLLPGAVSSKVESGAWNSSNPAVLFSSPVIVNDGSAARKRFETAFDDFRALFPIALCYTKIVPVDEVVTLTLFHREDEQLRRLFLDEAQARDLERLWNELHFVSESPLTKVDAFEQIWQYSTQDGPDAPQGEKRLEPLREPIMREAEAFKKLRIEVEPKHVQAVLEFAMQAWRRPLSNSEQSDLRALYQKLREQELPHASAVRILLARVLVTPAFLYRGENSAPGPKAVPVNDWELATRLSYFLWSSAPDSELCALASSGKLRDPEVLSAQVSRMMKDVRIRRLAIEFGCQWLHVRDVDTLDEKSDRHFPTFVGLRADMQEEAARFFMDLFQGNRSMLSLLDADHSFLNGALAKHYGLAVKGEDWQRVDGMRAQGRGGVLGFAATLAKQAGASRTSPTLRGNWINEVVLGEKMPRPPKGVPVLPEEAPAGLTERQLIERHSSDPKCAGCHQRMDPFGFALEGFDAIGRARKQDAAGLVIDTRTTFANSTPIDGLDGLRTYLLNTRGDDFVRQFCRKLLGYALGRSVQLSDKPLIETMLTQLKANDYHVSTAIKLIVRSPQFREVRGRDFITSH
jgi:hypothetical protein